MAQYGSVDQELNLKSEVCPYMFVKSELADREEHRRGMTRGGGMKWRS